MLTNVFIKHYKRGALIETRAVHNSWAERGRTYLRDIVAERRNDLTVESRRIKYMSLGIGGEYRSSIVLDPPLAASHSPGEDPRGTVGNTYTKLNLTGSGDGSIPDVTTLEMPARVSGTSSPPDDYPAALVDELDTWYIQPPYLFTTILDKAGMAVHAFVDCRLIGSGGREEYIYDVFTEMPITEAGLHLNDIVLTKPYEPLVAYVNFGTILLDVDSQLELIWQVRFTS